MDLADGNQQEIIAENKEQIRAMAKGDAGEENDKENRYRLFHCPNRSAVLSI